MRILPLAFFIAVCTSLLTARGQSPDVDFDPYAIGHSSVQPLMPWTAPGQGLTLPLLVSPAPGPYAASVDAGVIVEGVVHPRSRFWLQTDYLLWWISGYSAPALASSSPQGTTFTDAAVLPSAKVLYGNTDLEDDSRSGRRLNLGGWIGPTSLWGIDLTVFMLPSDQGSFRAASDGDTALGIPFFNVDPLVNDEDALVVGFTEPSGAPVSTGSIDISTSSDVYSGSALIRKKACFSGLDMDLLGGYRFFRLDEGIVIQSTSSQLAAPLSSIVTSNGFNTVNQFHGGEWGLAFRRAGCRWALDTTAKIALGVNRQRLNVEGQTTINVDGFDPTSRESGLFAQNSNSGEFRDNKLAVLTEFGANSSYSLTRNVTVRLGYTILYFSDALRPGPQIDRMVDGQLLIDPNFSAASPAHRMRSEGVWLHGLNLGVDLNF